MSEKIRRSKSAHNISKMKNDSITPRLDDLIEFCGLQQNEESGKKVVMPSKFEDRQHYYQELSKLFRSFLKKCLCLESLLFLVDAQNFKAQYSGLGKSTGKIEHAQLVYKKYLKQSATHQINVDETLRISVKEKLKAAAAQGNTVDLDIFDPIEKAIYILLEEDSFQKFLKSDNYKQFSQKWQNPEKKSKASKTKSSEKEILGSPTVGTITTQAEVGLQQCRRHSQSVLDLYKERDDINEVMEYITTVQHVADIADLAIKNRVGPNEDSVKHLQMVLRDYKMFLEHYKATGRFGRVLTSARLKNLLDQYNFQVWSHLDIIQDTVKRDDHSTPSHASTLRKITQFFNAVTDPDMPVFHDDSIKTFWERYIGLQKMWGNWTVLRGGFESLIGEPMTAEEQQVMKYLLDSASTGAVSQYKLAEFLKGFGPLRSDTSNCVKLAREIVLHEAFYGYLSKYESEFFLSNKDIGTYMIRFLKAKSSSFSIAYVDEKRRVAQIPVEGGKGGFKVAERGGKDKHFETLFDVIEANKEHLITPLVAKLPFQPYFWGDITSLESGELLAGLSNGTFLIRLSSSLDNDLVISLIENGEMKHWPISKTSTGKYSVPNSGDEYDSIEDLIKHHDALLKNPLPRPEMLVKS